MQTILVTWWTWYIGSHGVAALTEKWYDVIIVDNLSNSSKDVLNSIEKITWKLPKFYEIDLRNKEKLEQIFQENKIDGVIHFAWAKAVGESCEKPFFYYENNIVWSLNLFEFMDKYWVKNIIFSSSATVYKPDEEPPFSEENLTWNTTNPYGTTKFIIENILRDLANHRWFNVINLRYFNPIWAHKSWLFWENPNWIPNNLLPFIMKVATWELEKVKVFWNNYPTKDGTWERDYIHVLDLIAGHIKALEYLEKNNDVYEEINLWTWKATSVLDMIKYVEETTWKNISYEIVWRRDGDIAVSYCKPAKANKLLNWEAKYSVEEWIQDSWNFMKS